MMNRINRVTTFMLLIILMTGMVSFVQADSATDMLSQPAPFGVVYTENGTPVQVFQKPGSTKVTGTVSANTLCVISSVDTVGGTVWYKIKWRDNPKSSMDKSGYVMGDGFYQLTYGGMLQVCTAENIEYLRSFSEVAGSIPLVEKQAATRSMPTDAPSEKPKSTVKVASPTRAPAATQAPSNQQSYVLNTNTKKFHYPDCYSVTQMKPKNRRDVVATREELMRQGYDPCGRCHP